MRLFVHELIAVSSVHDECLETVARSRINVDSKVYITILVLAHDHFLCGAKRFVGDSWASNDDVLLDHMSMSFSPARRLMRTAMCCSVAFFLAPL